MGRGGYQRHRSAFGHGDPTELQVRTWELVEQTGSQTETARILGCSQGAVQSSMKGYQHAMGLTGPLPGARVYKTGLRRGEGLVATLRARITELERERDQVRAGLDEQLQGQMEANTALLARIAELELLAHPWVAVHAKLDQLLARPAGIPAPTHRRQADGGIGGRKEVRALRATA